MQRLITNCKKYKESYIMTVKLCDGNRYSEDRKSDFRKEVKTTVTQQSIYRLQLNLYLLFVYATIYGE